MKKIFSLFLSVAFVLVGCATMSSHRLSYEYYETKRIEKANKIVWHTERVYPANDVPLNTPEQIQAKIIWLDPDNGAIGLFFDDLDTPFPYDYCGYVVFPDEDAYNSFLESGDFNFAINSVAVPCPVFKESLDAQVENDTVVQGS